MVRNCLPFVGSRCGHINEVHSDVIHIEPVFFQAPIHQCHVTQNCVAGLGIKVMSRHAERVPVVRVWDVILHQLRFVVRGPLRQNLQIDPSRRMARSNTGLDAKFVTGLLHQREVHDV